MAISVPIAFNKIGIFTGKDNSFAQSLTNDQFAKIFRGEITDWKDVGGEAGPIVFVDRPDNSDTRVSSSRYPVFKAAPFAAGTMALNASASPATSPATPTSSIAPATVTVNTPAVDPSPGGGFDLRWLLPLIGIPLIGAWLFRRKPEEELGGVGLGAVVPATAVGAAAIGTAGLGALGLLGNPKPNFISRRVIAAMPMPPGISTAMKPNTWPIAF